jgi:uncharacterized protein YhjY with autotransporter beta-barrel domain
MAALLSSPAARSQQWQGGTGIYLNATTGGGQLINFRNPGDGSSPNKAYFTSLGVRVLSADVISPSLPDAEMGNIDVTLEGDSCIRVTTTGSPLDGYTGAMTIRVVAQDKSVRSGLISEFRDLVSIQGAAPGAVSCDTNDPPHAESFTTAPIGQTNPGFDVDLGPRISDADGDPMTLSLVQVYVASGDPSTVGTVTSTGSGFTFVPNRSFSGTAVIEYHVSDGNYSVSGGAAGTDMLWMSGLVSIPVTAVNEAPVASDDATATDFGQSVTIDALLNDQDPDGDTLTIIGFTTPDFGNADIANNQLLYVPPQGFSGVARFSYTVSDGTATDTAQVSVTVRDPGSTNQVPTVTIPAATNGVLNFPDTDGAAGENITIVSQADDPEDALLTWTWVVDGSSSTTQQASLQLALTDGTHSLQVSVSDGELTSSTVTVSVVVAPAVPNTLPTLTLTTSTGDTLFVDTDREPGESVGITATANDADGSIVAGSYRWTVNSTAIPALNGQANATLDLDDGESTVSVSVTDDAGGVATATVTITVSAPIPTLASVAANPVQAAVGASVDTLCPMLNANAEGLTGDAPDLLGQCSRIIGNSENPAQQQQALQALSGEELQAAQTASITFSKVQASNIAARLQALRGGARGVSISGLNLTYEGEAVPLSAIGQAAKALGLVTGRCDADGGLADQRLGIFLNGKIGFGDKDTTANETGYDYDTIGATLGVDYRFTDSFVAGLALGYSESKADFVLDQGNLESNGLSGNLFGSWYKGRGYLDVLAGYGQVDYDSLRHISYQIGDDLIDREALGSTDGTMSTAGVSFGYDLGNKGWTITPNVAVTYMKVEVDGFTETGSQGLDLEYGDQSADSLQYQAGLQVGYRFSRTWGVITPQVYGSYVVDKQDIGSLLLRFANDPFSGSPNEPGSGTVFFVTGDEPDEEYFRWGVSLSAVFKNLVSAFVSYESYAGLDTISYGEVTVGVRLQTSF